MKSILRNNKAGAFSSAGLEHLPYKQRVGGSNPSTPTMGCPCGPSGLQGFLFFGGCAVPFLSSFAVAEGLTDIMTLMAEDTALFFHPQRDRKQSLSAFGAAGQHFL